MHRCTKVNGPVAAIVSNPLLVCESLASKAVITMILEALVLVCVTDIVVSGPSTYFIGRLAVFADSSVTMVARVVNRLLDAADAFTLDSIYWTNKRFRERCNSMPFVTSASAFLAPIGP